MGYQPIEELLPKAGGSIYKLIRLACDRAIQLADGKKALVESTSETKTATIVLDEIRAGKVVLKDVAAEFEPEEEPEAAKEEEE